MSDFVNEIFVDLVPCSTCVDRTNQAEGLSWQERKLFWNGMFSILGTDNSIRLEDDSFIVQMETWCGTFLGRKPAKYIIVEEIEKVTPEVAPSAADKAGKRRKPD